jgi:molybdate transport system ATP-binding protein
MLRIQIRKQFSTPGSPPFLIDVAEEFPPSFSVLFGPSGAGKSTLLDCIAGLLKPDDGWIKLGEEVFFHGEGKICLSPQRRHLAYVFQSLALFPHLPVEENVGYGLATISFPERHERIGRILRAFHIEALRSRKPGELSGGEKQRVALARSLATQPRILLLDEPLTGLDSGLRQAILEDLREWNELNRIPILYVTHNREEIDAIGERVITLLNGRVRERGAPGAVLDAPRSVALARATGFENILEVRVHEHRPADGVTRVALLPAGGYLEIPLADGEPGISIRIAIRAGDILVATQPPVALSARNILPGTIESIELRGALVVVQVNAGAAFTVHVTPGALRSLQLSPGLAIWLILKTYSCHMVS